MFLRKENLCILLTVFLLVFSVFAEEITRIPTDLSQFYVLEYNQGAIGKDLQSPERGTIVKEQKSGNKTTVIISCSHNYYWKGKEETCKYEMIIYNIEDYKKMTQVNAGDVIGKISNDTALLGRCKTPDPYLVLESAYPASIYEKMYYFQPGWLTQTTDILSYRQVESFEDCVNDYFSRWKSAQENAEGETTYNSLFNHPDLDSISFRTRLDKLPEPLNSSGSIGFTSTAYFGRNIWETFTLVDSSCEYTPVLCWQYNFKSYLESEYEPGSDIYIYGTFLALDHIEKRILFNVRDFLLISEEENYEQRLTDIREIQ